MISFFFPPQLQPAASKAFEQFWDNDELLHRKRKNKRVILILQENNTEHIAENNIRLISITSNYTDTSPIK